MGGNALAITPTFLVGNISIPLSGFDVTLGTYGSSGHCNIITSRSLLAAGGVDLVELSAQAPSSLEVGLTVSIDGIPAKVFGGEYVSAHFDYRTDQINIHCRDYSGLLVDQKRVISTIAKKTAAALPPGGSPSSSGISNQNQSLSQMVTAIANEFGLTPKVNIQGGNNPTVGSILGSQDTVFMPTPKSLWGILCRLARETGYEVHTTPMKELVFGTPGSGATPIPLAWNIPGADELGLISCDDLDIEHNPRRNLSFRVLVLSYDPAKAQTTKGEAYVVGTNQSVDGSSTVHSGLWTGPQASQITNQITPASPRAKGNMQIPLYTIRVDGLTQAQAQAKASAIAADIAKRELIMKARIDMLPTVVPLNPVSITGDIEPGFVSHKFYVNACKHVYRLPGPGGTAGTVYTQITALDVQTEGVGDPVTTGGANA